MELSIICLKSLRNKVFKLLPMREDYDKGECNHLSEYIENLIISFDGAMQSYPELLTNKEIIDVKNNIAFLKLHTDVDFKVWRATILRSTRLLHAVLLKLERSV